MKNASGLLIMAAIAAVGIASLVYGTRNWASSQASGADPEPITPAELEKGVPDNPYRKLTGRVVPLYESVVYEKRKGRGGPSFEIGMVYYAAVSPDNPALAEHERKLQALRARYPREADIPAAERPRLTHAGFIIKTKKYLSESQLESAVKSRQLPASDLAGLVINRVGGIGKEETALLRQGYPGFDPDTTVIFELDRLPPSGLLSMACMAIGLLMAAGAVLLMWMAWRSPADA